MYAFCDEFIIPGEERDMWKVVCSLYIRLSIVNREDDEGEIK
jgi:hypothetical protein